MVPLADRDELALFLERTVDENRGTQAVTLASGIVRAATGQTFSPPTAVTRIFEDPQSRLLFLPHPSTVKVDVDEVKVNGTVYAGWRLDRLNTLSRDDRGRWHGTVEVTYTHGADKPPDAVKAVVLAVAARLFTNSDGVTQKSIGDVSLSYGRAQAGPGLTEWERSTLEAFRYPAVA
jgi:hypothetical protein